MHNANNKPTAEKTEPEIVARRTTLDGVRIFVHADGSVSDRMSFLRARLKPAAMWRWVQDICILNYSELEADIRASNERASGPRKSRAGIRYDATLGMIVHDPLFVRWVS